MHAMTDFAFGEEIAWSQVEPPTPDASRTDRLFAMWPRFCQSMNCTRPHPTGDKNRGLIPSLLDTRVDENAKLEFFDVALPGMFAIADEAKAPRQIMPEFLRSTLGAETSTSATITAEDLSPEARHRYSRLFGGATVDIMRVALSYFALPRLLEFTPSRMPDPWHQVYIGQLSEGSDAIWDLLSDPHGCIGGATGSGKSWTVDLLLPQLHAKGFQFRIVTPKRNDPMFTRWAGHPQHKVVTGARPEDLAQVLAMFEDDKTEAEARQEIRGEHGVDWWHETPDEVRVARGPIIWIVDEAKVYFWPKGRDQETLGIVQRIVAEWNDLLQMGRSENMYGLALTQSPYVDTLGGGFAKGQIHFWLMVRRLEKKWGHDVYADSMSANPPLLWRDGGLPQGRGIVRGVVAPDNAFASAAVNDGLVQVAVMPPEARDHLVTGVPILPAAEPTEDETTIPDLPTVDAPAHTPEPTPQTPPVARATAMDRWAMQPHTIAVLATPVVLAVLLFLLLAGGALS